MQSENNDSPNTSSSKELPIGTQRKIASAVIVAIVLFSLFIFYKTPDQPPLKNTTGLRSEHSLRSLVLPHGKHSPLQSIVDASTSFNGEAMFMPYKIIIGESLSREEKLKVQEIIEKTFWEVHTTFNHFNNLSEISQINKLVALSPRKLSAEFLYLFNLSHELHYLSQGKFDPSLNNLRVAWTEALKDGRLLSKDELQLLAESTGWKHVEITAAGEICKLNSDLKFDFSSIAKGYSVDVLCERLKESGFCSYLVEWGGETRVAGRHPQNRAWRIALHNPCSTKNEHVGLCEIDEGAVATSGHSEQYWVVADEDETFHSYSHLINPYTLMPLRIANREIISCTVCAPSCALADALATAGLLFDSIEEALAWSEEEVKPKYPECDIYFLSRDGVLTSKSKKLTRKQHGSLKIDYLRLPPVNR